MKYTNPSDVVLDWEMTAIVNKRTTRWRVQYLVRWLGFGPEEDLRMDVEELSGCAEAVKEYEISIGNIGWEPLKTWKT